MQCPVRHTEHSDVLLDYCRGNLDAQNASLLEQHIAECEECRQFSSAQRAVSAALDAWEPEEVSADFDAHLYAKIEGTQQPAWFRRLSALWKPVFPFAAAAATAAVAALLMLPADHPSVAPGQEQMQIGTFSAEEVERALEDVEMLAQFSTQTL